MPRQHSPLPRCDDSDESSSEEASGAGSKMEARFWWEWDRMVWMTLRQVPRGKGTRLVLHMLWACAQWVCICCVTAISSRLRGEAASGYLLLRNAFLFHYLAEFLGCTGMYSGFSPLFPFTWYRFARGTLKEPCFSFLGDKRTTVDVVVSTANVVVPLCSMVMPESSPVLIAFAACVASELVLDYSAYIGSMGCFYGPISLILAASALRSDAGHIVALQILLLTLYVSCGIAKLGPGFVRVMQMEWTQPVPFAGKTFWRRLFFEDFEHQNFAPTRFANVVAYGAAVVETVAPLLFLCTPAVLDDIGLTQLGTYVVDAALIVMCSMHAYIVFHFSSDVNMMNSITMAWCIYVFRIHSWGFDYEGFAAMHPWLRACMLVFILCVILGHLRPDIICSQLSFRFWAGNWPQTFYVFSESGRMKMARIPANTQLPPGNSGWCACAYLWAGQICARVLPALLYEVGKSRPQLEFLWPAYSVVTYCLGSASNCSLRAEHLNPRLQRACQFQEGEALCVVCGGFIGGCGRMRWKVIDLAVGVIATGSIPMQDVCSIAKPSDCKQLLKHLPLTGV